MISASVFVSFVLVIVVQAVVMFATDSWLRKRAPCHIEAHDSLFSFRNTGFIIWYEFRVTIATGFRVTCQSRASATQCEPGPTLNHHNLVASMTRILLIGSLLALPAICDAQVEYGTDISFAQHYETVSTNYAWLPHHVDPENNPTPPEYEGMPIQPLGDMKKKYDDYIQGCVEYYGEKGDRCTEGEQGRVAMSLRQPQSMRNYTEMGYTKIRAPDHVFKLLKEFYDTNKGSEKLEKWTTGNIYT